MTAENLPAHKKMVEAAGIWFLPGITRAREGDRLSDLVASKKNLTGKDKIGYTSGAIGDIASWGATIYATKAASDFLTPEHLQFIHVDALPHPHLLGVVVAAALVRTGLSYIENLGADVSQRGLRKRLSKQK